MLSDLVSLNYALNMTDFSYKLRFQPIINRGINLICIGKAND
jgi:hypothetical protein